ncbi:MAG TPA: hypothetical protein VNJ07_10845, partial [Chitinophagales bacterium]|nr:hypothetical protein [Chitinophagales bacterium]
MTWKLRLVLLFAKFRKPIDPRPDGDVAAMRREAERAAKLGAFLFDDTIGIETVVNESADGVPVRIYKNSSSVNQRVMLYYHGGGFVFLGLDSH